MVLENQRTAATTSGLYKNEQLESELYEPRGEEDCGFPRWRIVVFPLGGEFTGNSIITEKVGGRGGPAAGAETT